MNLETIQSMWEKDSQIDIIKVHEEAAKIPSLHAKYWDVYNSLKLLKEKAQIQEQTIRLDRHNYYSGKSDPDFEKMKVTPQNYVQNSGLGNSSDRIGLQYF